MRFVCRAATAQAIAPAPAPTDIAGTDEGNPRFFKGRDMQTSNRIFDDLAKVASGAASALAGIKQEMEALVRQQVERLVAGLDLVSRDEFDAVRQMAANARAGQEELERRIAELEAELKARPAASEGGAGGEPER